MENISDLIVEKRKERGLTQTELGAMLGVSGKAVSKWERDYQNLARSIWIGLSPCLVYRSNPP